MSCLLDVPVDRLARAGASFSPSPAVLAVVRSVFGDVYEVH